MAEMDIRCGDNNSNILLNGIAGCGKTCILDILTKYFIDNGIKVISSDDAERLSHEGYMKKLMSRDNYIPKNDCKISGILKKQLEYNIIADEGSILLGSLVYNVLWSCGIVNINPHFKVMENVDFNDLKEFEITIKTRQLKRYGVSVHTTSSGSKSSF